MKKTRQNDKISSIVEISKLVTYSKNFFEIKDKIVEKMLKVVHPTKACINLFFKNNYKYAYLVCSATLNHIPRLFSEKIEEDSIKIDFDKYPPYIHEAVFERKIVWVKNVYKDDRAMLERPMAQLEGYVGRIVFPLIANNNVVGFITCYLNEKDAITTEDINFIDSIASLIGLSIEITKKNHNVDILVRKLRGAIGYINKGTNELYKNKSISSFLSLMSKQICRLTLSGSAMVILNDFEGKVENFNQFGQEDINIHKALDFILQDKTKRNGKYYNSNSLKNNLKEHNVRSLIYHKLKKGNEIIGFIIAVNSKKYSGDDLRILNVFSAQIGVALEMYEYSKKEFEHKLLEKELEIVSHQQRLIMGESKMKFSEFKEISFFHQPSQHIGGDFCEIIKMKNGDICIFLADVMGHGILSNYFVAMIKGVLKTLVSENKAPGEILTQMNRILYDDFDKINIFATARVGIFDPKSGKAVVANAGHLYPIGVKNLKNQVTIEALDFERGMPIGVLEDIVYEEHEYNVNQYEMICMFTDGIIEASNKNGEEYGLGRLKDFIYRSYMDRDVNLNSEDIFKRLQKELFKFTGEDILNDDLLILFIKNI